MKQHYYLRFFLLSMCVILLAESSFAQTFFPDPVFRIPSVKSQQVEVWALRGHLDGKVLIGGLFDYTNNITVNGLVRLNADGSLDTNSSAAIPQMPLVLIRL